MNVAFDVDGTIDAFPAIMQGLIAALMAAGSHVFIITGIGAPTVAAKDVAAKQAYLKGLGIDKSMYTTLIVIPDPHPENKAKAIKDNKIELLIDNNVANCKEAKGLCACLLLWNNKVKN